MIEAIIDVLAVNRTLKICKVVLIGIIAYILIISNVYELNYYRKIGLADKKIVYNIEKVINSMPKSENRVILLLNTKNRYVQGMEYRLGNCTEADWALTGALHAQSNIKGLGMSYPIPKDRTIDIKKNIVKSATILWINDNLEIRIPNIIQHNDKFYIYLNTIKVGELEYLSESTFILRVL
jgi:hypothetical protein